jgi:hypothetical protein
MILHVRTTNISPVKETAILVVNGPAPLLLYQSPPILENLCISFNISSCLSKFHGQMAASLRSTCCRFHFFLIFLLISSENYLGPTWRPCVILTCDSTILSPRLRRHRWKNLCPQLSPKQIHTYFIQVVHR